MPIRCNILVIYDTAHEINEAYREGAMAMRNMVPYNSNPYRHGSQKHADWDNGHINESEYEHIRFGEDVIIADLNGRQFTMDPAVPRDLEGRVDAGWYESTVAENPVTPF